MNRGIGGNRKGCIECHDRILEILQLEKCKTLCIKNPVIAGSMFKCAVKRVDCILIFVKSGECQTLVVERGGVIRDLFDHAVK